MQIEVLRPLMRLSFETFRLGLQVQSSMIGLFNNGRALMTPVADAAEAPSEPRAEKRGATRAKSRPSAQRAKNASAGSVSKPTVQKGSARKGASRRKG